MVLLPVRWETHAVPEYGDHPQAILNRRVVAECDMLIGAFWSRVGTPTGASESGTVDEIEQFARARKPVLLYFSSRQIDLDRIDADQLTRVRDLRSRLEKVALVGQFASLEQLEARLTRDLIVQMRRLRSESRQIAVHQRLVPESASPPASEPARQTAAGVAERLGERALGELYSAYWTRFSELVGQSGVGLRPPTSSTNNYVRLSLGESDMWMQTFVSVRRRLLGVEFILRSERLPAYESLKTVKEQIEKELGGGLEWKEHHDTSRIVQSRSGYDPSDRADWPRQHEWLIERVKGFQQHLLTRVPARQVLDQSTS
ncbi:MAG TPA: DUF4268 domain-containing protein [Longimicrobium sp.]|nr:DUF4268 domain-containing protein [Longimicrobium sp.]